MCSPFIENICKRCNRSISGSRRRYLKSSRRSHCLIYEADTASGYRLFIIKGICGFFVDCNRHTGRGAAIFSPDFHDPVPHITDSRFCRICHFRNRGAPACCRRIFIIITNCVLYLVTVRNQTADGYKWLIRTIGRVIRRNSCRGRGDRPFCIQRHTLCYFITLEIPCIGAPGFFIPSVKSVPCSRRISRFHSLFIM